MSICLNKNPISTKSCVNENFNNNSKKCESKKALKTYEIKSHETIRKLKPIIDSWMNYAETTLSMYSDSEKISHDKKSILRDSISVMKAIDKVINKLLKNKLSTKVYAALGEDDTVQCIASADGSKINLIATNPKNLDIFGQGNRVRGAGTALIARIIHDIQTKNYGSSDLHLSAMPSSIPFYKNLGFEQDTNCEKTLKTILLTPMFLNDKKMQQIVEDHLHKQKIKDKEPNIKELKFSYFTPKHFTI